MSIFVSLTGDPKFSMNWLLQIDVSNTKQEDYLPDNLETSQPFQYHLVQRL